MSKKLIKCKFCFEKINAKARRCSHCQADLRGFIDRHPIFSIFLGILVLIFIFFAIAFSVDNEPDRDIATQVNKTVKQEPVEIGNGKYKNYSYYISKDSSSNKLIAVFTPFLPRNDLLVTEMMLNIINKVYGNHNVADVKPQMVERKGTNLIMFKGVQDDYYFLLVKEDTGEVNSFIFWSE